MEIILNNAKGVLNIIMQWQLIVLENTTKVRLSSVVMVIKQSNCLNLKVEVINGIQNKVIHIIQGKSILMISFYLFII